MEHIFVLLVAHDRTALADGDPEQVLVSHDSNVLLDRQDELRAGGAITIFLVGSWVGGERA